MSDKINKSIQDRGWVDMRTLLDEELPVRKKRRRGFLWWRFGTVAMVVLLGVLTFPFISQKSEIAHPADVDDALVEASALSHSENKMDEGAIEKEEKVVTKSDIEVRDEASLTNLSTVGEHREEKISIADHSNTLNAIDSKNKNTHQYVNEKNGLEYKEKDEVEKRSALSSTTIPSTNSQGILLGTTQNNEEELQSSSNSLSSDPEQIGVEAENLAVPPELPTKPNEPEELMSPLPLLPSISIPFLNRETAINTQIKPILASVDNNSFSPYLFAGGNIQMASNGSGIGLGMGVDYGGKDQSVYLEAGYLNSKFDTDITSITKNTPTTVESSGDEGLVSEDNSEGSSSVTKLRIATDEIRINLGVRKRLFNNLKLDLGIAYVRPFNVSNESFEVNVKESSFASGDQTLSFSSRELYDLGAYVSYDFVPHIGLEYAITPNIHFGANVNYGLRTLIDQDALKEQAELTVNDNIYRRNLEAKIRYQF